MILPRSRERQKGSHSPLPRKPDIREDSSVATDGGQFLDSPAGLFDVFEPACCLIEPTDVGHGRTP